MKLLKEIALREKVDEATLTIINLWHELSKKQFGFIIEIMIGDRKEHRQLKGFTGKLSLAFPTIVKGKPVLSLWLDNLENMNPFILTHEIGHWVIKLQGFTAVSNKLGTRHSDDEIFLNSMCHHPVVFDLQRRVGHEPQFEIDSRARNSSNLVRKDQPEYSENNLKIIFLLADDIYNASNKISRLILRRARRFHSNIYEKIQLVNNILNKYDLLIPEENLQCEFNIIEELNMGPKWVVAQELDEIVEMVTRARQADLGSENSSLGDD